MSLPIAETRMPTAGFGRTLDFPWEITSLNWFGVLVNDDQSSCHKLYTVTNTMLQFNSLAIL